MAKLTEEFKQEVGERIQGLSNRWLYDELIELASGDDYDGCFSREGHYTYELLKQEMERRLESWFEQ